MKILEQPKDIQKRFGGQLAGKRGEGFLEITQVPPKAFVHKKGLCGKEDGGLPARCSCCGRKMRQVEPSSISMQQLGINLLVCDFCSGA